MNFFTKLQARLELRRLEDKYVRRTNRNTFVSGARYVDGEYVSASSQLSVSSGSSSKTRSSGGGLGRGKRWQNFRW